MKPQIFGLRVASAVFGLMALVQVGRLVIRPDVQLAGYPVPLWPSVIAVVVMGSLSAWLWKLSALRLN